MRTITVRTITVMRHLVGLRYSSERWNSGSRPLRGRARNDGLGFTTPWFRHSSERWNLVFATCLLALAVAPTAAAQTAGSVAKYPIKPIRVLVPAPPGSGSDVMTRAVTQRLSERLGQSVIADNRPGAAGAIALETLAHATPDGYTIGTLSIQNVTGMPMKTVGSDSKFDHVAEIRV